MSPEILNPESKVGTLKPKTFESGKVCHVNAFLSNPNIFPPATFRVYGRTKMAESAIHAKESKVVVVLMVIQVIDSGCW